MSPALLKSALFAAVLLTLAFRPAYAVSVVEVKGASGVTAYLSEDHATPVVAISFNFAGGTASDPADKQGLSNLGTTLINEGAADLDSFAFQTILEDKAITLNATADRDNIRGSLITTTPTLDEAVRLLRLALLQPRFDDEAIERMRKEILVNLAAKAEMPGTLAGNRLYEALFGDHPYSRDDDGTIEGVKKLTRADIQEWAKTRMARDRLILGVAGDITPAKLRTILDTVFGALPAASKVPATLPPATVSTTPRVDRIVRDLTQSTINIGAPGIAREDPDWYAATVADYIFGSGSFASRLMNEVREKRGLAYTVRSALSPYESAAMMVVSAGTRADQSEQSLAVIREEWGKMANPGVTQDELDGAKQYLIGAWPLRFTSTATIASLLVQIQRDHLGLDYLDRRNKLIEAVTLDDVRRVSQRLYKPELLTVVIVGPDAAKAAAPAAGKKKGQERGQEKGKQTP